MSAGAETFWNSLPLGRGVKLIVRDENGLVAFDKPAGVLSHPNEAGEELRALLQARYEFDGEYFEWSAGAGAVESVGRKGGGAGGLRRLWLLNRLDSATSGVILAAATRELAEEVRAQFKRKLVRKVYLALVFGVPRQPTEAWRDLLAVAKKGGKIRTAADAGHVPAESRMTVVKASRAGGGDGASGSAAGTGRRVALIKLEPKTGRSHQLRVQCAKRHLPIVGDQTYGDFAANRAFAKVAGTKRLFLHSMETSFAYEWKGRTWEFAARAELPGEFEAAVGT